MKHHTSRTPGPRRPLCCVFPAFCPRRKWYFILAKYLCVTLPDFKGFIDSRLRLSKFIKPECLSTVGKAWCRSGSAVEVVTLSRRRRLQSPLRLPATITRLIAIIVRWNGAECMHNTFSVWSWYPVIVLTFDAPSAPQTATRALIRPISTIH